jgi:Cu(I)/Ag(I) efflux system membrane fusion protein
MSAASSHKYEIFDVPDEYRKQIWAVTEKYLSLHEALASDDKDNAIQAAGQITQVLNTVDMGLLSGNAHKVWVAHNAKMKVALEKIKQAKAIEPMREGFEKLSVELIAVVEQFGVYPGKTLYKIHCPMSFNNKGADWLQTDEDIRNPYLGTAMPKCGKIVEVIGKKTI